MDISSSQLYEIEKDREAWCATGHKEWNVTLQLNNNPTPGVCALPSVLDQAQCPLSKHELRRRFEPILVPPLRGSSLPCREPSATYTTSTPL